MGMPELLVSDNGTQFTSAMFGKFCSMNGIEHTTTAPFHPQSNGQAERFVDTFKRGIKKIREGEGPIQEALDLFLLKYRSTPNPAVVGGVSPSEAMFGRRIRTNLELLRPPTDRQQAEQEEDQQKPRSFNKKDPVYVKVYNRNSWSWVPGTIVEQIGGVMYNVRTEKRRLVRSHVNQLRKVTDAWNSPSTSVLPSSATFSPVSPALTIPSISPLRSSVPASPDSSVCPMEMGEPQTPVIRSNQQPSIASNSQVQPLRRSSRLRRSHPRFDVYYRY
ncbi:uncharacterized protein K02A2.6-like [Wyeomyia smithii]|uniref:uncharacterized protein K02A2.6-like n=1 Tax=Wyeomyia smithii TaxID=174621 RepID=UPI002467EE35|nr:uncharacterized protein K02A2.6-like [Wyeomyia smithii]